jgi:hypothetical protein
VYLDSRRERTIEKYSALLQKSVWECVQTFILQVKYWNNRKSKELKILNVILFLSKIFYNKPIRDISNKIKISIVNYVNQIKEFNNTKQLNCIYL